MSQDHLNEKVMVELVCADCGLPIAGDRPRTDVTRYLSETSRCQCQKADAGSSKTSDKARSGKGIQVKVTFSVEDASEILAERFEVLSFLGHGGMGSVFKVKERASDKIFAVKLLNPQLVNDDSSVRRFEQEAKAAMHLTHAHLAAVYEYGMGKDDTPYLVMDFLEGTTLDQLLLKEKYLDHRRAIDLFIQICEAIEYAHYKGVIHRDIKPNNIIVTKPSQDLEFAKLFDFGIAKVLPNQAIDFTQDMTQTGDLFGSPLYMSPEQCQGTYLDEKTDIYSFGCVMYKTLTGKHPFEGKNFVDTIVRIIRTEPEKLSNVNPLDRLPKTLEEVVHRCLSKDTKYRYKSATALKADLECVRDGRAISKQETAESAASKDAMQRKAITVTLCLVAIMFAAAIMSSIMIATNKQATFVGNGNPQVVKIDPYADAQDFDNKAYTYFTSGKYEQAIPLLEFGIKTYKENGRTSVGAGREDNYLAENYSHLGKCYLMLKRYKEAVPSYREALRMFQRWGNYQGGMMPEAVEDYASVLRGLGREDLARAMQDDFRRNNNLSSIPEP